MSPSKRKWSLVEGNPQMLAASVFILLNHHVYLFYLRLFVLNLQMNDEHITTEGRLRHVNDAQLALRVRKCAQKISVSKFPNFGEPVQIILWSSAALRFNMMCIQRCSSASASKQSSSFPLTFELLLTACYLVLRPFCVNTKDGFILKSQLISSF